MRQHGVALPGRRQLGRGRTIEARERLVSKPYHRTSGIALQKIGRCSDDARDLAQTLLHDGRVRLLRKRIAVNLGEASNIREREAQGLAYALR